MLRFSASLVSLLIMATCLSSLAVPFRAHPFFNIPSVILAMKDVPEVILLTRLIFKALNGRFASNVCTKKINLWSIHLLCWKPLIHFDLRKCHGGEE